MGAKKKKDNNKEMGGKLCFKQEEKDKSSKDPVVFGRKSLGIDTCKNSQVGKQATQTSYGIQLHLPNSLYRYMLTNQACVHPALEMYFLVGDATKGLSSAVSRVHG